jgi:hypothetical protein
MLLARTEHGGSGYRAWIPEQVLGCGAAAALVHERLGRRRREPAIHGAAFIYRTPWVILGLGTIFNTDDSDANCRHE